MTGEHPTDRITTDRHDPPDRSGCDAGDGMVARTRLSTYHSSGWMRTHPECSDSPGCRLIHNASSQRAKLLSIAAQHQDRGTGTGDDSGVPFMAQDAQQLEALRHPGGTLLLVDAVLGGSQQQLRLVGQGVDEQGCTRCVHGRIGVRDLCGQQ